MKFEDFELYHSIYSVYLSFEKDNRKPRSSDWFIYKSKRKMLTEMVIQNLFEYSGKLYSDEEMLKAWDDFGKNKEKYKLIVETSLLKGCNCIYQSKDCSAIVSIDKLHSKKSTTPQNCFIVCKKHNVETAKFLQHKIHI